MLEYTTTLGLDTISFFSSTQISETLLPIALLIALITAGYLLKRDSGAAVASLVWLSVFLHFKGLLPF